MPDDPIGYAQSIYRDEMNVREIAETRPKLHSRLTHCVYIDSETGMPCETPEYARDKKER